METNFTLNKELGYFKRGGVEVMAFDDIYPEGHQSGVSIIMHGNRVATNGDIRFEQTPGQWQPVPKQGGRVLDEAGNSITTTLSYPDRERHLRLFNPMIYPDFEFNYTVKVRGEGVSVVVTVDLDTPVPKWLAGKLCFNLELFPGALVGKPWLMDDTPGIYPMQPNGPMLALPPNHTCAGDFALPDARGHFADLTAGAYNPMTADSLIAVPYAVGRKFTSRPDELSNRLTVETRGTELKLYDGRMNHNNGWFVLSSEIPAGATKNAVEWVITPFAVYIDDEGGEHFPWMRDPVVQVSQVGYHPNQPKVAIIELDKNDRNTHFYSVLYRITAEYETEVCFGSDLNNDFNNDLNIGLNNDLNSEFNADEEWGEFLRYRYKKFDFSHVKEKGLYRVRYGPAWSSVFVISEDVYDRGVWQPVLEYFLPVQMCHMRVSEKYRVWHGLCHDDDAQFAPLDYNHIDGYRQGPEALCACKPGDFVEGVNVGGWHDAGDFDLRVESQAGEAYILALTYEAFGVDYDATTICQKARTVEIHQPDGKNDLLQQIEHGALCVISCIRAVGWHWRGIIERNLRQYVHLGDSAAITDNVKNTDDDRWIFTENNPRRELGTAAHLAAVARVLRGFNDELARQALDIAREIFDAIDPMAFEEGKGWNSRNAIIGAKIHAAVELFLTTNTCKTAEPIPANKNNMISYRSGENNSNEVYNNIEVYKAFIIRHTDFIIQNIANNAFGNLGWIIARVENRLNDSPFSEKIRTALPALAERLETESCQTPYGIPYRPHIWGAGWGIQRGGFEHYFLHTAYPETFSANGVFNALNFVLGCHPGADSMSFASGVGAKSATVGYGLNRADWSYIPGGVVSGTALIRPDLPELLVFPFLWQQVEYVMGGGSSHYMFLVLAAIALLKG